MVLTIGTISVCGLANKAGVETKAGKETKAADVKTTTTVTERDEGAYTALDTVTWRKASINEYEIAEISAAETTTTTAATTKTTEKKTEGTTTSAATTTEEVTIEQLDNIELTANGVVNLRKENSKNSEVLAVIDRNDTVTASAKTSDGWYEVSYEGVNGYVMEEFLEEKAEETTTAETEAPKETDTTTALVTAVKEAVETTQKTTTTTAAPKTEKETTTTAASADVISYSAEEFDMLCYVLQNEVGNCSDQSKIAVANVIINRVKSSQFPDTIEGVLTAPNQFTAISNYYGRYNAPTQSTIDCAARALAGEDNTNGATYYYAPRYCGGSSASWFESLQFCMELDGQRYFKNW